MSEKKLLDSDEREFLHDIASPLAHAILTADSLIETSKEKQLFSPDDAMRFSELLDSLLLLKSKIGERREILIRRGVPSARS